MRAPPVAKPKARSTEPQRATVAAQRPSQSAANQAHELQRHAEPAAVRIDTRDRKAAPRVSWDFSKIPVFAPGQSNQQQTRLPSVVRSAFAGQGQPLKGDVRELMEARFGHDFSQVRVYTDARAAAAAEVLGARGFAYGDDVVLRSGSPSALNPVLVHELAHVVQQKRRASGGDPERAARAAISGELHALGGAELGLHLDDDGDKAEQGARKAVGERLWRDFPNGVSLAFFGQSNDEAKRRSAEWAIQMNAVGFNKKLAGRNLVFGANIEEPSNFESTVRQIADLLEVCAELTRPAGKKSAPLTLAKIKTLAIFAHGTSDWCGMSGINASNAAAKIKAIAPRLTEDVNVIFFTCNSGTGQAEQSEDFHGAMREGGADSLAGIARDTLIEAGLSKGSVWGHSDTGHVTENYRLREFRADKGKGAQGQPFATEYGITVGDQGFAAAELLNAADAAGFELHWKDTPKLVTIFNKALAVVEWYAYDAYRTTARESKLDNQAFAQAAPTNPAGAGKIIRDAWNEYWPKHQDQALQKLIRQAGLKQKK